MDFSIFTYSQIIIHYYTSLIKAKVRGCKGKTKKQGALSVPKGMKTALILSVFTQLKPVKMEEKGTR